MANLLSQKAVLADLTIRRWTGRKLDRKVTEEVNTERDADTDAARVNKMLISKKCFADIHRLTSGSRQKFYLKTIPWSDSGPRILPSSILTEFTNEFRTLRQEFEEAVIEFDKNYPKYVADKKRLGKMFNPDDYPDPKNIRKMFSFAMKYSNIPDSGDLRVDVSKEQLADLKAEIESNVQGALREVIEEPARRIVEVVGKMSTKLQNYKPATEEDRAENTFRDSLVENIRDLVPLLTSFNLLGDKRLTTIITRVEKELCKNDADVLREDEDVRKKVQKAADDILKQANALMA